MQCRIKYEGFDNELDNADVILIGEVNNITEYPKYDELSVKINKVEKGIIKEDIQIRNYLYDYSYTYNNKEYSGQTNTKYQTGEKYLFILQHIENVYEDKYVILSDIYIPISTNEKSSILSNPIDDITDPIEYVESYNYKNIIGLGKELSVDYIKSKDTNTIIQESPYIAEIIPKMLYETTETVDVYLCDVVESLKGTINSTEENQIIVPFFKNTVKEHQFTCGRWKSGIRC